MKSDTSCKNCHSPRRPIKARGLCTVCFTWQRRIDGYVAKLERAKSDPGKYFIKYGASSLPLRIDIAERVLQEFRWREEGLQTDSTDEWHLEALVNILAQASRSKFPLNTNRLIYKMSPQSRRLMYEVLLAVVENIPTLDPLINDGWGCWYRDYYSRPEFYKQVIEKRALEKAYQDSRKRSRP